MDKIAVLIPCYNEAETIADVVSDFKKHLPKAKIYVYDNNSTDKTSEIAKKAGAIVRHAYMQGKGNVMRKMFREINAECYIIVDGDNTYSAKNAPEMVDLVLNKDSDMVVGDRLSSSYYVENKRRFHNLGNSIVRKSINLLFGSNIKDIMTGYRALSYQFAKTFPVLSKGFEIETEMSIHAVDKKMLVNNVVVDYKDRPDGSESKLNTYSDGIKVIFTIIRLYRTYKPLGFFSLIALLFAIISIALFVPVAVVYFQTGMVPNFPTLIVSGFIMLAAIQALFTGLTLQTMRQKDRQDFEMNLINTARHKDNLMDRKNAS